MATKNTELNFLVPLFGDSLNVQCLGRQEGASQTVQKGQVPTNH